MTTNVDNSSVFVSGLSEDVTEAILFNVFSYCGPIVSIRICRQRDSRRSLGYGYVNYTNTSDARLAVQSFNLTEINGKTIGTSLSVSLERRSNKANVFVKNLDKCVDNKRLYELFSPFGAITSHKVQYVDGVHKGFGFVQFWSEQSAIASIVSLNGRQLDGKTLICSKFQSKTERQKYSINNKTIINKFYANLFVKNMSEEFDDQLLTELFRRFGKVVSAKVVNNGSKYFGFVALEDPVVADNAIKVLNGKPLPNGSALYVSRAHKRLVRKFQRSAGRLPVGKAGEGVVYVKHQSLDEPLLRKLFSPYGPIKRLAANDSGFGFVWFGSQESAQKSLQLNNSLHLRKSLFVSMVQTIEERNNWSAEHQMQRTGGMARNSRPIFKQNLFQF